MKLGVTRPYDLRQLKRNYIYSETTHRLWTRDIDVACPVLLLNTPKARSTSTEILTTQVEVSNSGATVVVIAPVSNIANIGSLLQSAMTEKP